MKYVVFLRGINVGGIKVPMKELKDCLSKLKVKEVKTYLQTGNVTLESDVSSMELKSKIEKSLTRQFNYQASILLYPFENLSEIIENFPFPAIDDYHSYVIFCESQEIINELISCSVNPDTKVEKIAPGIDVVYWQVPKGSSTDSIFARLIIKSKYKTSTTTRNISTLKKIV